MYQLCIYAGIVIVLFGVGIYSHINYKSRFFNNTIMITDPTLTEFVQEYLAKKAKLSLESENERTTV